MNWEEFGRKQLLPKTGTVLNLPGERRNKSMKNRIAGVRTEIRNQHLQN
jgi:hypothetical protein